MVYVKVGEPLREFMGNNVPMLMNSIPTIRSSPCKNGWFYFYDFGVAVPYFLAGVLGEDTRHRP